MASGTQNLSSLFTEARACRACEEHLPHGPRPIIRGSDTARVLIVGQAPGARVHASGIPWDDASGKRLREWLDLDEQTFYDESRIALVPMGFCYPGRGKSGDLPPRRECASLWHHRIRPAMPRVRLVLLVGSYAQHYFLADRRLPTLTETVRAWRSYLPAEFPLPHPSPRNQGWLARHPWFTAELLPELRSAVRGILGG